MLDRKEVLKRAIHDCFTEMYEKAQPSISFDQIIQEFKDGKRSKDENFFEHHYLSKEEFDYIVDKYREAYNITPHWKEDVEVVEEYLTKGGHKDKYIPEKKDADGFVHPGYRSYEEVPPLKELILQYLSKHTESVIKEGLAEDITNIVMNTIKDCKNYYRFDNEDSSFRVTTALGASPTSDPVRVKKFWKEKTGEDFKIEERNPKLFWYQDMGYDDEDMEYEFDDPNWKETLAKEWQDELKKREEEAKKRREELEKILKEREEKEKS